MKTEFHTVKELLDDEKLSEKKKCRRLSPIDLAVIPNYMGINLCSVEGLSWTRQDDGQLVSLTIHFDPASEEYKRQHPSPDAPWKVGIKE